MAEERKKLSPVTLGAGALASVTSMVVGSLFGDLGTLAGAALSSISCSSFAFFYEDGARRAHARLRAHKAGQDVIDHPERHHIQAQLPRTERTALRHTRERQELMGWTLGRKLALILGTLVLCLGSCLGSLFLIESATGQTLSSNLGGPPQYGTTLGHHASTPPPTPTVVPSSSSPSVTLSGSPSASSSPSSSGTMTPPPSPNPDPDASPNLGGSP